MEPDLAQLLDEALARVHCGESIEECLASYPEAATELAPLLRLALSLRQQAQEPLPDDMAAWVAGAGRQSFEVRVRALMQPAPLAAPPKLRQRLAGLLPRFSLRRLSTQWLRQRSGLGRLPVPLLAVLLLCLTFLLADRSAAQSLPGELLYGWKLAREQALLVFAESPRDRSRLHLNFAAARVAEIEDLSRRVPADPLLIRGVLQDLVEHSGQAVMESRVVEADQQIGQTLTDLSRRVQTAVASARLVDSERVWLQATAQVLIAQVPSPDALVQAPGPTPPSSVVPATRTPAVQQTAPLLVGTAHPPLPPAPTPSLGITPSTTSTLIPGVGEQQPVATFTPSPYTMPDSSPVAALPPSPTATDLPEQSASTAVVSSPVRPTRDNTPVPTAPHRTPFPTLNGTPRVGPVEDGTTSTPAATAQPSPVPGTAPEVEPTATATPTPSKAATATATATPTPSKAATATTTATPTPSPTVTATEASLPAATPSATPTRTPSPTPSTSVTATPTHTPTRTTMPTATPTETGLPAVTTTSIATPTRLPTATATELLIATETATATATQTALATATTTPTATATPTLVPTATATTTPTALATETPTVLPTALPTPTATETPTLVPTATATATPSPTATHTPTTTPTATDERRPVSPIVECTEPLDDESFVAYFGYFNPNETEVRIPVGPNNRFVPGQINQGQPEIFAVGRSSFPPGVVRIEAKSKTIIWALDGRTATASLDSRRCDPPPAGEQPTDYAPSGPLLIQRRHSTF